MAKVLQFQNNEWYQLKISLKNIKPPIWRRFVVESNIKLPDLHKVIQTIMGWTNSHLHQFIIDGEFYSEPDEDSFTECIDYRKIYLNQILSIEKQATTYEYDFGDGWVHKIVLEDIAQKQNQKYPVCLAGKRACPPEDCGGPYGYEDLLNTISNPKNEEYNEIIEWLGDDFDPEYIDIEEINEIISVQNNHNSSS